MRETERGSVRRPYYGIAEIAESLNLGRQLVTVWRKRRSHGMPEPDAELASGPIWRGETVEPWIDQVRTRLGLGDTPAGASRELALRCCRRILRLAALLLEEPPRPRLLSQALQEAKEILPLVEATAPDELGGALRELIAPVSEANGEGGEENGAVDRLREQIISSLSVVARVAELAKRLSHG